MIRFNITPTLKILLILILSVFIIQKISDQLLGIPFTSFFGFTPVSFFQFYIWQIITYSFLHGGVGHLFFNMIALVFIAGDLETLWGRKRFLTFYFFCVLCAAVFYLCATFLFPSAYYTPLVGASGGIYGILIAFGILYSERELLIFGVFPLKAKYFALGLVGINFLTSLFEAPGAQLSAIAHLGGLFGGVFYLWGVTYLKIYNKNKTQTSSIKKRKASHLRLVPTDIKKSGSNDDDSDPKTWH